MKLLMGLAMKDSVIKEVEVTLMICFMLPVLRLPILWGPNLEGLSSDNQTLSRGK